ncbi:MAG: hypothetical protein AAF466_00985 [Bacteroidota bacterium]
MNQKRWLIIIVLVGLALLVPLIAMQFTDEVQWTTFDFVVAGGLLLSAAFICDLTIRKFDDRRYRIGICMAVLMLLALVFMELAVGIFGTPFAGS